METPLNKDERIEIRLTSQEKRFFMKAQKISGDRSFSSFVVRVLKEKAEEIVAKNDRILATERDRQVFFDAVFGNAEPNEKLIEAVEKYKSKTANK